MNSEQRSSPVYSIGHSTRTADELVSLLRENGIATLADIRRFPGSRRHPHFSSENLARTLAAAGIAYVHLEALGGHRKTTAKSPNTAWRNDSFRGYADHMATAEFQAGVDRLEALDAPVAYMCAEAVPWRCHRNLLSDELVRRGRQVQHILGPGSSKEHVINPAAREVGGVLVYADVLPLFG
jgi:uncharacterized protein (DUF488 family)